MVAMRGHSSSKATFSDRCTFFPIQKIEDLFLKYPTLILLVCRYFSL